MPCCSRTHGPRGAKSATAWNPISAAARRTSGSWRPSRQSPARREAAMTDLARMDRREFVTLMGGGIVVVVSVPFADLWDVLEQQGRQRGYPEDVNAYLHIATDGRITLFSGKIEMGQGVMTSLTQMAAEELGVSLESVHIVMGDTAVCPWHMGTFGSLTTRMFGPALRAAGAEARAVLLQLASERLGLPGDRLVAAEGAVSVKDDPSR